MKPGDMISVKFFAKGGGEVVTVLGIALEYHLDLLARNEKIRMLCTNGEIKEFFADPQRCDQYEVIP